MVYYYKCLCISVTIFTTTYIFPLQSFSLFYFSFIIQVGHAVCTDDAVMILKNYYVDMKNFQDTLYMASQLTLKRHSLRKLVAMFLAQRLYVPVYYQVYITTLTK